MNIPSNFRYTKEHEWAEPVEKQVKVGITDYAQQELGDVVFVDLPEVGSEFNKGDSLLSVESVKAVSDVYAPVSGKVVEVNELLTDAPEKINEDAYGDGWMVKVEFEESTELEELFSADRYKQFVEEISK